MKGAVKNSSFFCASPIDSKNSQNDSKLLSPSSSRAELHVDMRAKVFGFIDTLSREISCHNAARPIPA
jgi:hypothetical protein